MDANDPEYRQQLQDTMHKLENGKGQCNTFTDNWLGFRKHVTVTKCQTVNRTLFIKVPICRFLRCRLVF